MKYDVSINSIDSNTSHGKILAQIKEGAIVLECGCATGYMTRYMKEVLGCKVSIVEYDQTSFEKAIQYAEDGICTNLEEDAWFEKYKDREFDYILLADVLEHLRNSKEVLEKAAILLKEDGKLFVSVPNIAHNDILIKLYNNRFDYTNIGLLDDTHIHFWGYHNLDDLFEAANLRITQMDGVILETGSTEQGLPFDVVDSSMRELLGKKEFGNIYQFVCTLQNKKYVEENKITYNNVISNSFSDLEKCVHCKVYFETEDGFSEAVVRIIRYNPSEKKLNFEIELPQNCKCIRFDPIEQHGCVIRNLRVQCGSLSVQDITFVNGFTHDDTVFFGTTDPQIMIRLPEKHDSCLKISARIIAIPDPEVYRGFAHIQDCENHIQLNQNRMNEIFDRIGMLSESLDGINVELTQKNQELEQKDQELTQKNQKLEQKDQELMQKDQELAKKDQKLVQKDQELTQKDQALVKKGQELIEIKEQSERLSLKLSTIEQKHASDMAQRVLEIDRANQRNNELSQSYELLRQERDRYANDYLSVTSSDIWRLTKPLRFALDKLKRSMTQDKTGKLFLKGLRSIKNDGLAETGKKTIRYLKTEKKYIQAKASYEKDIDFSRYTTDIKTLALYLPQFHEIPENNEWWGKGFTEWTNVKKGKARFDGHNQPRVPDSCLGYYDLSEIETLKKQIALAKKHGIYGFAFYYYWFSGHRLLEKPMDMLLDHAEIDFPFMAVWANENWTRTWDGKENSILIEQKYTEDDAENFILDLKKYLVDKRYIRVDGKPVIGLYAPAKIPNVKYVLSKWRETARTCGIGEILIWVCTGDSNARYMGVEDFVDGEYEFPPRGKGFVPYSEMPDEGIAFDYKALVESSRNIDHAGRKIPYFRGSMMEWDNAARKKTNYHCWNGFTPERFYIWNRINVKYLREAYPPEYRFLFVNAWNEWGEGTYLEPDRLRGYACINALSKAIMDIPYYDVQKATRKHHGEDMLQYLGCGLGENVDPDWDEELKEGCKIAVQAHVFYPELIAEITEHLNFIPYMYDLYVSTTDHEKAEQIRTYLKENCSARAYKVCVYPNKGRDVVPFLYQMKPVIGKYKYFCHIHTKKSLHTSNLGDIWRTYLYSNLLGSPETLKEIFYIFENQKEIGVVFPENLDAIRSFVEWGSNRAIAEKLTVRMNLDIQFPDDIMFPAGNMFWARTDAVKEIFEVDYVDADFPDEGAQVDGTLMHAIERLWLYVAQANGYGYQTIRNLSDNRPFDILK